MSAAAPQATTQQPQRLSDDALPESAASTSTTPASSPYSGSASSYSSSAYACPASSCGEVLPRIFDYVDQHARAHGDGAAIVVDETGEVVTWSQLSVASCAFAAKLVAEGVGLGDRVCSQLPNLKEHVYLFLACLRVGAIFCPLDLRVRGSECIEQFGILAPKAFFFLGKTEVFDFRPTICELIDKFSTTCTCWVQFQKEPELVINHPKNCVKSATQWAADIKWQYIYRWATLQMWWKAWWVTGKEPAVMVFTTGSTGLPKPAMLSQSGIIHQSRNLARSLFTPSDRLLLNLPLSHVGGITEMLCTLMVCRGTAVLIPVFNAEKSLAAIKRNDVTILAQIPAMYNLMWRLPSYSSFDLSSLRMVAFGGQSVTAEFVHKLSTMAPYVATGFGLTETCGFCSAIVRKANDCECLSTLMGPAFPDYPVSIRSPVSEEDTNGTILPEGTIGEICYQGPQTFLGYYNLPEETRKVLVCSGSTYPVLHTGDMGVMTKDGIVYSCRRKFMIKPKGYLVYPPEVEDHIVRGLKGRVEKAAVVGVPHNIYSEGIVAFVELSEGSTVTPDEVKQSTATLTAYKRPQHIVVMKTGAMPLNRMAKVDYKALTQQAMEEINALRAQSLWDS
ncbi:long-chain fatty acid--CoA ligase [Pelomyxa schiedti]|nr:long-chain fatty acid--CoA ligase [Pelomyxa schiedti]